MTIVEAYIVPDGVSHIRLVDYAYKVLSNIPSRSGLKKALKRGEIWLDGKQAKGSDWLEPGKKIELIELQNKLPRVFEMPLDVVFEDDYLAIINKPAGISVSGNKFKTIVNALPFSLNTSTQKDALKVMQPVHRLDYPTSGLLLIAKTSGALIKLGRMFEEKKINKQYRAIVVGKLKTNGLIDHPINGQSAITKFELVSHARSLHTDWISLVDLFPLTGRTHQLRIHMSELGHPILGDRMYDKSERVLKGKGMFLAAVALQFTHPVLDSEVSTTIEEPHKFTQLLSGQQRRWNKYN